MKRKNNESCLFYTCDGRLLILGKNDIKIIKRINKLLKDIKLHPYKGIGKPEPLKFQKSGYWSRRIDLEHRLVYKIANNAIYIVQCRYHY